MPQQQVRAKLVQMAKTHARYESATDSIHIDKAKVKIAKVGGQLQLSQRGGIVFDTVPYAGAAKTWFDDIVADQAAKDVAEKAVHAQQALDELNSVAP